MPDDPSNIFLKHIPQAPTRKSRLALASFICGNVMMIGFILGFAYWPLVALGLFCIPAVVTGHLARRAIRKDPHTFTNAGMATYGLAAGYLGVALNAAAIAVVIVEIFAG